MLVKFEHLVGDFVGQSEIFAVGVVFQLTNPDQVICTVVPDFSADLAVFPPSSVFCQFNPANWAIYWKSHVWSNFLGF